MDSTSKKHPVYVDVNRLSPEQGRLLQEMNRCVILTEGNPHDCVMDNIKTLRDEFAMAAMGTFTPNQIVDVDCRNNKSNAEREVLIAEAIVKGCYEIADAMLAERIKE